mgnify:CR=1 FL=1
MDYIACNSLFYQIVSIRKRRELDLKSLQPRIELNHLIITEEDAFREKVDFSVLQAQVDQVEFDENGWSGPKYDKFEEPKYLKGSVKMDDGQKVSGFIEPFMVITKLLRN